MTSLKSQLALTLSFFTRLALPKRLANSLEENPKLNEAVAFFPLIGLLIGISVAFIWHISSQFFQPAIAAGLAIVSGALITGALHEDGLADCADGLGATPDRERALEIMRDSRIGTYGVIALIGSFGLRWTALASFDVYAGIAALIIAHCIARSSITLAMQYSNYARSQGLGSLANGEIPARMFMINLLLAGTIALLAGGLTGLVAAAFGFGIAWCFLKFLETRLGGYTGDGLGGMEQLAEITILIALAGFWI
ncbi:MAG: adenosylcobinamide-GDP ribazoletransferase [Pseudomonadota bacterium]